MFIELKVPFLTKILVCWVFSGQKESKPNSNPKTYNQEAKVAFIAPSRPVVFSPLTSHTQRFLQQLSCTSAKQRAQNGFVCLQQTFMAVLPVLMQLSRWQHLITHFLAEKMFSRPLISFSSHVPMCSSGSTQVK